MAYRNKTFVSFASEDIHCYRLMTAWKANKGIEFNFSDAHDINTALDTSQPETIKRRLRERLANTREVVLLVGDETRKKAARSTSFIYYEVEVIRELGLPVIFANLNGSRESEEHRVPAALVAPLYTISVSFQPAVVAYALDNFPAAFRANPSKTGTDKKTGLYYYKSSVYQELGI